MKCPICSGETTQLFQKYGYWIRSCKNCHHRFAEINPEEGHVKKVYCDHYFNGGKDGYPDYLAEADLLRAHGRQYGELLRKFTKPGLMLDVGCAAGFIMQGFEDAGWSTEGTEPNEHMAEYARQQGLKVFTNTLENFQVTKQYDLVVMIQVLPHFYDLKRALEKAASITKPGGYWLIETWNRDSVTAKLIGQRWHEYSPPSVLHWFSASSLDQITSHYGFFEIDHGRPIKKLNVGHASAIIANKFEKKSHGNVISSILAIIPNQFVVPYLCDDIFWVLYQNNLNKPNP